MPQNQTIALFFPAWLLLCLVATAAQASNLDTIGVTLLRQVTTNLNGAGVRVGQVEAQLTPPPARSVGMHPAQTSPAVNLPVSHFSYHSNTTATTFPNSLGVEAAHADTVAQFFYGLPMGVATNVSHIDNYEGDYFIGVTIPNLTAITNKIVNQSFIANISQQVQVNTNYDNYAAMHGTLFISGVGDSGNVNPPATCYNGIGVAAYGGASSIGPTTDNKRSKPDLTAPADATSDSTPLVAGAAAILLQAGLRGDGGSDTNSAADARTLRVLLLNGAIKPTDWTNGSAVPLDQRYGAGVLNVFESYKQLAGGKHAFIATSSVAVGGAHPPTGSTNNVSSLFGWDLNTDTSSSTNDTVNHYYFNLPAGSTRGAFTATATLVWNRQQNKTAINEVDLYLYEYSRDQPDRPQQQLDRQRQTHLYPAVAAGPLRPAGA